MIDLRLGDCLDVLATLPDASVDAVVTDPPWMDYATSWYDASKWHRPITALMPEAYLPHIYRLLRTGCAMLLWCRWDCFENHAQAARNAGFVVKNCVVWAKSNHTAGDLDGNFGNKHEMAVFAVKGRWLRPAGRDTNLWEVPGLFSRAHRDHPTQKPIQLMRRSVTAICPHGGTVLDPFMGSGTTGVACVQGGYSFIGIERDPAYFAICERRLADAQCPLTA